MRRRPWLHSGDEGLFSPLLDVLMNGLGAILLLLLVYIFFHRNQRSPCVLILAETNPVFRFTSGSAAISPEFRQAFETVIVPQITERARLCDGEVIEVVGHTDQQALRKLPSTLDRDGLAAYRAGKATDLVAGSNVDLGYMRAISVVGLLRELQAQGRLPGIKGLFPLSAGPAILPDLRPGYEGNASPDAERRRIEIRILLSRT